MSLRGSKTTEAISHTLKNEIATLPLVAHALKDDLVILRKCPWGAMTKEGYGKTRLAGDKGTLLMSLAKGQSVFVFSRLYFFILL